MPTEVIIALIGLAGVLITAGGAIVRSMIDRRKLGQAEREIRFQRAALGFPEFVSEWGEINDELTRLISDTEVDRVMILRAWNGHLEPRWTTAVFQIREAGQAPVSYVHYELDQDYISRVREIVQRGPVSLITSELKDCEIKKLYEAEGVTASLWAHLDSFETTDGGAGKAIAYVSFSTHSADLLSDATVTRCRILTSRLKGLAQSFDRNSDISYLRPK